MRGDPRGLSVGDPGLTATRRELDRWRRSAGRSRRIPPELWARARELAHAHGVARTARVLGLDYYALAKRVQATERHGDDGSGFPDASAFVAVQIPAGAAPRRAPSGRLELSDGGGVGHGGRLRGGPGPRPIVQTQGARWRKPTTASREWRELEPWSDSEHGREPNGTCLESAARGFRPRGRRENGPGSFLPLSCHRCPTTGA
jgi:hypothetical protein